jgi:two-component system, chemotaxis family, CheB/CheR fusion protein
MKCAAPKNAKQPAVRGAIRPRSAAAEAAPLTRVMLFLPATRPRVLHDPAQLVAGAERPSPYHRRHPGHDQVFGNLLNNAGKYTDRGGHIVLTLSAVDGEAVVKVSDNGAGIAPSILPHVFDLFVQSESTRAHADGGLGIGLTLVRQIVEAHRGTVAAASGGSGQGSEFTVRLPLITTAPPKHEPERVYDTPSSNFQARRVLVVDDNVDAANSVAELIRMWGHEVAVAYDGFAGLDVARTFVPEVALLDIGLPSMSGHTLAGKLRQLPTNGLFLIALTGYGQETDRKATQAAGFDVHLIKPVDAGPLQTLLATLQTQTLQTQT